MAPENNIVEQLSYWWRRAVIITMLIRFIILILVAVLAYRDVPPIPDRVVCTSGETLLTGQDIMAGQEVFLRHGRNGDI
jgi:nitric oxide reductase subunit B